MIWWIIAWLTGLLLPALGIIFLLGITGAAWGMAKGLVEWWKKLK